MEVQVLPGVQTTFRCSSTGRATPCYGDRWRFESFHRSHCHRRQIPSGVGDSPGPVAQRESATLARWEVRVRISLGPRGLCRRQSPYAACLTVLQLNWLKRPVEAREKQVRFLRVPPHLPFLRSSGRYFAAIYARTGRDHRPEAERSRRLSDKEEQEGSTPSWSTTKRCEGMGYFW